MLSEDQQSRYGAGIAMLRGHHGVMFPYHKHGAYTSLCPADVLRVLHNAVAYYTEAGRLGMAAKQLRVSSFDHAAEEFSM